MNFIFCQRVSLYIVREGERGGDREIEREEIIQNILTRRSEDELLMCACLFILFSSYFSPPLPSPSLLSLYQCEIDMHMEIFCKRLGLKVLWNIFSWDIHISLSFSFPLKSLLTHFVFLVAHTHTLSPPQIHIIVPHTDPKYRLNISRPVTLIITHRHSKYIWSFEGLFLIAWISSHK